MRKILFIIAAIILAVMHAVLPEKVDVITVVLLGASLLPWVYPMFKSVDIPGVGRIEFSKLEEAEKRIVDSGLVSPEEDIRSTQKHSYAFQALSEDDPNLVLSALRAEIESQLRELAEFRGIDAQGLGTPSVMELLEKLGTLSRTEAQAIRELLPLLDKAAHGGSVDKSALIWAMDFGPRVLRAFEERVIPSTISDLIKGWKRRDGAMGAEIGMSLSKSFINSPESFLSSMNRHPDEFETWVEGLGYHTFTIFDSSSELENKLYLAQHEKLKTLMIDAAESCMQTQYRSLASKIKDAVSNIKIDSVW